jgi:drug/metabolite transporter (DMT)-like permease
VTPSRASAPVLFAVLCIAWGTSWIAMKLALAEVPPFTFTVARSLVAGVALLAVAGVAAPLDLLRRAPWHMLAVALLTNTLTYAGLYWGTARVSVGLAAIVNNALMPLGLFALGLAFREEAFSRRRLAGIALGAAGLALLFAPQTTPAGDAASFAGLLAVAGGTLAYCLGSVWSRPLLRGASPVAVAALQMLAGGLLMVPIAILAEKPDAGDLAALLRPVPLGSLAWLALPSGAVGLVIYLRLIRDWGPTRAGMYAFVSPLIAVALGAWLLGERLGPLEWIGGAAMLGAAALVLPGRAVGAPSAAPQQTARH